MSSIPGFRGVYAVDWAQVALGDEPGLAPDNMALGMSWRWHGQALRLDGSAPVLWLDHHGRLFDARARVRERLARLALAPSPSLAPADTPLQPAPEAAPAPFGHDEMPPDSFSLTDGLRLYHARLVRRAGRVLAAFSPFMPPAGQELWVSAWRPAAAAEPGSGRNRRGGVICFLPGTRIDTLRGPRPVEALVPGEKVITRDNGAQPVIWRGETQLSGAELYLYPHLRPVRIGAGALAQGAPESDLLVSPRHRLLIAGAEALFNTPEVLAAAEDLLDGRAIRRDFTLTTVTYVHLMLPRHEIIRANGLECESFHPALADPAVLKWHARSIERACPGLVSEPQRLGPEARRCLNPVEAEIMRHALA
ncbi:MAG: Hint domain-containing protein [Pararhodobacter sp.]|nr:Hint domain-containing protein [Pararhodobacter sp.]